MTTLNVYLSKYSVHRNADLATLDHETLASDLYITCHEFKDTDYLLVGTAEVAVTLLPRADVLNGQIKNLRAQIEETRREAGVKVLQLERQINSLLAIEGAAQEIAA